MSDTLRARAVALLDRLVNDRGWVSGDYHERKIDIVIATFVEHDRRVTELLEANNREVERRRVVENALRLTREWLVSELDDGDFPQGVGGELEGLITLANDALGKSA